MKFNIKKFSTGLRRFSDGSRDYFVKVSRPSLFAIKTLKKQTMKDPSIHFRKHKIKKYKIWGAKNERYKKSYKFI